MNHGIHEHSAVKISLSTYVWSKVDSCFCESVYLAGRSPEQLVIELFAQHQRFAVCCPYVYLLFFLESSVLKIAAHST